MSRRQAGTQETAPHRVFLLVFVGALVMQASWILAVPPYRGIDEFDHAYRAAAVVRGEWRDLGPASGARGDLVTVPRDIVRAAQPACADLTYVEVYNCYPREILPDGLVTVGSGAANYNPLFYWVIGIPSLLLTGEFALLGMRVIAALLAALLIAAGAQLLASTTHSRWPLASGLLAVTPVMLYSTAMAAPNGIEMASSFHVWATLLALTAGPSRRSARNYVLAALPSIAILSIGRTLGPLWLALIVLTVVMFAGKATTKFVVTNYRGSLALAMGIATSATAFGAWWTLTSGTNSPETVGVFTNPVGSTARSTPLWFLQSIAAFPFRNQPAPTVVYASFGIAIILLLAAAWLKSPRTRLPTAFVFAVGLSLAWAVELSYYGTSGTLWQGRYGWPLSMGALLIAGQGLASNALPSAPKFWLLTGASLCTIGHAVSVAFVLREEGRSGPLASDPSWLQPPTWLAVALMLLGLSLWCRALLGNVSETGRLIQSPSQSLNPRKPAATRSAS